MRLLHVIVAIGFLVLGAADASFIPRHLAIEFLVRRSPRHVTARRTWHDDQEPPWYLVDSEARYFLAALEMAGFTTEAVADAHPPMIVYSGGASFSWSRLKERHPGHLIRTSPGDEDEMTSLVAHKGFDMRHISWDWYTGRLQKEIEEMMLIKNRMRGWTYNAEREGGQWEYGTMDIHAACFITGGPEAFKMWIGNKTEDEAMNEALQYLSDMDVSVFYYSSPLSPPNPRMNLAEAVGDVEKEVDEYKRERREFEQWVAEKGKEAQSV
ncbi:unnamed protein product [Vitrella brassicaformis CCMP3155]|uniref:Uncharacterized protein n=1 Tax=Vitrella brassicaformis (strain CCMP3155) TaxID=1169540 RepID=A0A0G4FHC8_VITBC|nr:unnamed protein product [Vitrella brassicaformis CCMP3155]|eukprot:CEM12914.1 unnamed protein product [Vitrella brassicaformis CCMP3155]